MKGHSREQLETRRARLENYTYCRNCGLYWARALYKKHLRSPPSVSITIIPPAMARFLDFLANSYVDMLVQEHTTTLPDGTKIPPRFTVSPEWDAIASEEKGVFTVDEAVERFRISREAILVEIEKNVEVFRAEIPGTKSPGRKERRQASGQEVPSDGAPGHARLSTT